MQSDWGFSALIEGKNILKILFDTGANGEIFYMGNILGAAGKFGKIYGIIGGLHGFSEFNLFKGLELICPTHCIQHKKEIKQLYPRQYITGGAGKIINI